MILFFIMIFLFLSFMTCKIKVVFNNLDIDSNREKYLDKNFSIKIIFIVFGFIPIFMLTITNDKIKRMANNEKIKEKILAEKNILFQNGLVFDKKIFRIIKNNKIFVKKFNLNVALGTEDMELTVFLVPTISTLVAFFLEDKIDKSKNNSKRIKYSICPMYNQNYLSVNFNAVFEISLLHLLCLFYLLNKEKNTNEKILLKKRKHLLYNVNMFRRIKEYGEEKVV